MGRTTVHQRNLTWLPFLFCKLFICCLAFVSIAEAQIQPRADATSRTTSVRGDTSLTGSPLTQPQTQLPGAARITPGPAQLSLSAAIDLALANNLATLLAQEQRREASGIRQQARSGLLPNIDGNSYQASITENLAALGFQPGTFPGFTQTFIGPFNNFDA
ncbi:MAG TPA: hypothetical protein VLB68_17345, partial [Pyrinomonadaceae bacterium]|nr:hypothetical protein [Pyrinomonadaceae bacterium]